MMVADSLCEEPDFLDSAGRIGEIAAYAVGEFQNFCELGHKSEQLVDFFDGGQMCAWN
jgi:hypothetical protein